jgi:hypothetical protein
MKNGDIASFWETCSKEGLNYVISFTISSSDGSRRPT